MIRRRSLANGRPPPPWPIPTLGPHDVTTDATRSPHELILLPAEAEAWEAEAARAPPPLLLLTPPPPQPRLPRREELGGTVQESARLFFRRPWPREEDEELLMLRPGE